jgi:hypothetical protein
LFSHKRGDSKVFLKRRDVSKTKKNVKSRNVTQGWNAKKGMGGGGNESVLLMTLG